MKLEVEIPEGMRCSGVTNSPCPFFAWTIDGASTTTRYCQYIEEELKHDDKIFGYSKHPDCPSGKGEQ